MWCGSPASAAHFVFWLYAECAAFVTSRRFQHPLAAVTDALIRHGTLSGDEVHRLVDEHTPTDDGREEMARSTKGHEDAPRAHA